MLPPMADVGSVAFPKLSVASGRDYWETWLGLSLPSPWHWTRYFLGLPTPEQVILQGLKNAALNHNLTRTQMKGAGSRWQRKEWRNQSLPAGPTAEQLHQARSATTSTSPGSGMPYHGAKARPGSQAALIPSQTPPLTTLGILHQLLHPELRFLISKMGIINT